MAIFFILFIIVLSILVVHALLKINCHYLPESLAIVVLGTAVGFILNLTERDWSNEESFKPNTFFLIMLPPIIFESGYNLHKGNFFANIGSILVFAIIGTLISALIIGSGIFILGEADLIFRLSAIESFGFGAVVSAVDPVATLAIFQALDVDPILYMLVFGESVLNDAVAIVLANTIMELDSPTNAALSTAEQLLMLFSRFGAMFFLSAALGVAAALCSALLLKHVDLRRTPSLEFAIMLVFAYLPYGLAEGLHLSGIMAILFCGIVMSHYTHFNLSPLTQLTMQLAFRTMAFVAETCVFAYLGMAFFTLPLNFEWGYIIWAIVLCLLSRAVNIFPLSALLNQFREHKITRRMQFVMWFSGLRGAIAFALSLHMPVDDERARHTIITTTLILVVFTIVVLGGATLPFMKLMASQFPAPAAPKKKRRRSRSKPSRIVLSKTHEIGGAITDSEHLGGYSTTSAEESGQRREELSAPTTTEHLRSFYRLDAQYLRPFFTRKFTAEEKRESTMRLTDLALRWFHEAQSASEGEDEAERNGGSMGDDVIAAHFGGGRAQDHEPLLATSS